MIVEKVSGIEELSASEKLLLVGELWNDLAQNPTEVPVPREIIAELDTRIKEYEKDPTSVTNWMDAKARIIGSKE